jgi:hypothetical protein
VSLLLYRKELIAMFYTQDSYEAEIGMNTKVCVVLPSDLMDDYTLLNGAVKSYKWTVEQLHKHFNK